MPSLFRWIPCLLTGSLILGCAQSTTDPAGGAVSLPATTVIAAPTTLLLADVVLEQQGTDFVATVEPQRQGVGEPPLGTRALVDAMGYLDGPLACRDCLSIVKIDRPDAERVAVTFAVAHPFAASSGRWDLHLFDVRGHLYGDQATWAFPATQVDLGGPAPEPARAELVLENPDGYSSFVDGVIFPSLDLTRSQVNLRPYKLFWEDFTDGNWSVANPGGFADLTAPRGRNVFPVGGTVSDPRAQSTYVFHFANGLPASARFTLALDVSYAMVRATADPLSSRYLLPYGNQVAPIRITPSVVSNDLQAGDSQSSAVLEVRITDWQALGDAIEDPELFNFATAGLDEMQYESAPQNLVIEVPGLLAAPITRTRVSREGGEGTPADPLLWRQTLRNELGASEGRYYGLLSSRDSLTVFPTSLPLVVERDGRTVSGWQDITTYQVFQLDVAVPTNLSPQAELLADRTEIVANESVEFCPGPGTMDPDGEIVLWEYDYDFNPADPGDFQAEDTRTSADPDPCVDHVFTTFGLPNQIIFTVGMRVTDDGVPPRRGYDWVQITVDP